MRVAVIVPVIVVVTIERQRAPGTRSEERAVFWCGRHDGRRSGATDMAIQADDPVGRAHHDMQFMADHENGAAGLVSHGFDLAVEGGGTVLVQALGRLVEQEDIRLFDQGPRKQNALKLPARQTGHLSLPKVGNTRGLQRGYAGGALDTPRQTQEPFDRDWQCRIDVQTLRHIADTQSRLLPNVSARRFNRSDYRFEKAGFTRSVRPHNRDDFTGLDCQVHVAQNGFLAMLDGQVFNVDQAHRLSVPAQSGQTPSASTTVRSI